MSDERPTPTGLAGGSNLDQLMPVVLFFVLFNTVGIIWAVLAATAWSIPRLRSIGFMPAVTALKPSLSMD